MSFAVLKALSDSTLASGPGWTPNGTLTCSHQLKFKDYAVHYGCKEYGSVKSQKRLLEHAEFAANPWLHQTQISSLIGGV